MSDGANCMIVAKIGWLPHQVAIVGGNCSVTILDAHGTEIFWMVMGGIVTTLAAFDFDGDGENEVGRRSEARWLFYRHARIIISRTPSLLALFLLSRERFSYRSIARVPSSY